MACDRDRRETALALQMEPIGLEKILARVANRRRPRRDDLRLTQHRQQPAERPGVRPVRRAVPRPLGQILADEPFLDIVKVGAGGAQPKSEVLGNAQKPMAHLQAVAGPLKLFDVKMDVLAERAAPQALHHPASVQIIVGDHGRSSAHLMCVGSQKLCRAESV